MRTIKAKLQKVLKRHGKFVSRVDLLKSINREQLETIREMKKELEQMNNPNFNCINFEAIKQASDSFDQEG